MSDTRKTIEALDIWKGAVAVEPLTGGLSNESYAVADADGKYVVRFGRDFPFHHVFRDREVMTARAAHAAGFAPEVVHDAPGLMVSRFITGKTYDAQDVTNQVETIVPLVRQFHDTMPRFVSGAGFMFWVFHVVRDYARTLKAGGSRFSAQLGAYLDLADEMERAQVPLPIVFGHNDLLPANFIDDGERLWLIDFEYAGFSTAMFDLAGIASNAGFDEQADQHLLALYFGSAPAAELLRSHAAMKCASLLREAMWSMVSELHLNAPGANYEAYTKDNLDRLTVAVDSFYSRFGKV